VGEPLKRVTTESFGGIEDDISYLPLNQPIAPLPPGTEVVVVEASIWEALEEIRQRVADGWAADRASRRWIEHLWGGDIIDEPMSEQLASLLWPEDTSGA
jgi:hypothetical protein